MQMCQSCRKKPAVGKAAIGPMLGRWVCYGCSSRPRSKHGGVRLTHVNPELLARELDLLKPWERLV